jgi:hypothetical protein
MDRETIGITVRQPIEDARRGSPMAVAELFVRVPRAENHRASRPNG